MASKRSTAKSPPWVTRAEFNEHREEMRNRMHGMGVLLERVDTNVRVLAEGMTAMRQELKGDIAALEARLTARIENLEAAVRQNSIDIRKNSEDIRKNTEDIRKNTEDIRALRMEVAQLRHDFDHRAERTKLSELESRVSTLEKRLGID